MKLNSISKKLLSAFAVLVLLFGTVWITRRPLMRWFGNGLIDEDALKRSDVLFVLSGNPEARAKEAARLYRSG